AAIRNAPTRDRGRTMFKADLPSTISAQPHGASRHEETDRVSPRKRTHPTIHFTIRCPSTLHTESRRKPAHVHRLLSSPSRTNTQFYESMTCLTNFGEPQYFPNWICGPDTGRYEWRTIPSTKLPSKRGMGRTIIWSCRSDAPTHRQPSKSK
ncbi:hypothetical protein CLOM_g15050, partial [Closterium sp. NIES-68]